MLLYNIVYRKIIMLVFEFWDFFFLWFFLAIEGNQIWFIIFEGSRPPPGKDEFWENQTNSMLFMLHMATTCNQLLIQHAVSHQPTISTSLELHSNISMRNFFVVIKKHIERTQLTEKTGKAYLSITRKQQESKEVISGKAMLNRCKSDGE